MTVTKSHLIDSIHKRSHLPKTKSTRLVDSLLEIIKKTLEGGEGVLISGFGKFGVKENNKKNGKKPRYEVHDLGARRVVTFKCSSVMGDNINRKLNRTK